MPQLTILESLKSLTETYLASHANEGAVGHLITLNLTVILPLRYWVNADINPVHSDNGGVNVVGNYTCAYCSLNYCDENRTEARCVIS
jgi:hypothetical protein